MDSNIIDPEGLKYELMRLCEFKLCQEWQLLYCGSENNFDSCRFHMECDDKSPTLVIVKSTDGAPRPRGMILRRPTSQISFDRNSNQMSIRSCLFSNTQTRPSATTTSKLKLKFSAIVRSTAIEIIFHGSDKTI